MSEHSTGPRSDQPETTASAAPSSRVTHVELATLLNDPYARRILAATREAPVSARELLEVCEASRPTVYRRLSQLERAGLLETTMEYDPDGHHRHVFRAIDREITISLDESGFSAAVE